MGHQKSCARKIVKSAQDGQGYEVVEGAEQQITGAVVDGSPAYQTTAPASAARAD